MVLLLPAVANAALPVVLAGPKSQAVPSGGVLTLQASVAGATTWQWRRNGKDIPGAIGPDFTLADFQVGDAGIYSAVVSNASGSIELDGAIVGLLSTSKVIGDGIVVGTDIRHPNGNTFDQILLTGPAATVTADPGQITRVSYIDLDDDIVQLEFSGAGTLTILLEGFSPAAPAAKYNQPGVLYVKGHASLFVSNADETTNLSIFSVGPITAVNPALFRRDTSYDGIADLGLIAVHSPGRRLGAIRAANAVFFAASGKTGIYAPAVTVDGPVYLSDIVAEGLAVPLLIFGSASDVRITGGELVQLNGESVQVSGITEIDSEDGTTSAGALLLAQPIAGRLEDNGVDVTAALLDRFPVAISQAAPTYPYALRVAGITGEVVLEFVIDTTGHVQGAFAVSSTDPGFARAALNAVDQWLFEPGRKGGRLVNTRVQQSIGFTLSD